MIDKRLQRAMIAATGWFVSWTAVGETVFTVDFSEWHQTIENIGSSTGMHGDYISKHWKPAVVDSIADLLFSRKFDDYGNPQGIGLSSFRIQIGGGAEGVEGGIRVPWRRTECFLQADGTYDWDADSGVLYWRRKVQEYAVPTTIGYFNSPPVYFTENGYAFKTDKQFTSNLKADCYGNYAEFVAKVATHFQALELPFAHISPLNEPQWEWHGTPGKAKQEGTPWTNDQIARLIRLLDSEFREKRVKTSLLIPEAAEYKALYMPMPDRPFAEASDQVRAFWSRENPTYLGNLKSVENVVAGHAYFSDYNIETLIRNRLAVKAGVREADSKLRFWQTEYSLLGEGWTGGLPEEEIDEMTAALLLARNVHVDFTLAEATAWQWWSSTEPGQGNVPRYCLIECDADGAQTFRATKLLWALGHYSRFVRPGMVRVAVESDAPLEQGLARVMASAYYDAPQKRWVMVLINLTEEEQAVSYKTRMLPRSGSSWRTVGFQTDRRVSMQRFEQARSSLSMPPKSMVTLISGIK